MTGRNLFLLCLRCDFLIDKGHDRTLESWVASSAGHSSPPTLHVPLSVSFWPVLSKFDLRKTKQSQHNKKPWNPQSDLYSLFYQRTLVASLTLLPISTITPVSSLCELNGCPLFPSHTMIPTGSRKPSCMAASPLLTANKRIWAPASFTKMFPWFLRSSLAKSCDFFGVYYFLTEQELYFPKTRLRPDSEISLGAMGTVGIWMFSSETTTSLR